jgi:hypothetical protein
MLIRLYLPFSLSLLSLSLPTTLFLPLCCFFCLTNRLRPVNPSVPVNSRTNGPEPNRRSRATHQLTQHAGNMIRI